jgi:DNA-binding beta-propeller fold protein YncE
VSRLPLPARPDAILISADGQELYVVDGDRFSVVDIERRQVAYSLPVAPKPRGMTMTPNGSKIVIGHTGALTIIDTRSRMTTTLPLRGDVYVPAATADGRYVYIPACTQGLLRLEITTGAIATIRDDPCPLLALSSPDGQDLWVSYESGGPGGRGGHDAIARFDQRTGRLFGSITGLPNVGGSMAISPDGRYLLESAQDACANPAYDHVGCTIVPSGLVHVIDTRLRKAFTSLSFASVFSGRMAFSPNGRLAVISGFKLLVFDAATWTLVGEDSREEAYGQVVFSPDGTQMYVVSEPLRLGIYALD